MAAEEGQDGEDGQDGRTVGDSVVVVVAVAVQYLV